MNWSIHSPGLCLWGDGGVCWHWAHWASQRRTGLCSGRSSVPRPASAAASERRPACTGSCRCTHKHTYREWYVIRHNKVDGGTTTHTFAFFFGSTQVGVLISKWRKFQYSHADNCAVITSVIWVTYTPSWWNKKSSVAREEGVWYFCWEPRKHTERGNYLGKMTSSFSLRGTT